jgi:peptidoglycan/xylan/chitin deacetylase (PgdA/CDA1 family)
MTTLLLALAALGVAGISAAAAYLFWDESRSPRLELLMYHRFATAEEFRHCSGSDRIYSIPIDRFEEQLQYLKDRDYHFVSMDDAVAFAEGRRNLPQPAVLITIDDGSRCTLTRAEPVLARLGARAILFVTTDPRAPVFDSSGPEHARLSELELREIRPDVIEIAAHGVTHRPLTSLSDAELSAELRKSRDELERIIGRPVTYMAAPGGWYDERVRRMAAAAGYAGVCTSDVGTVRPGHDPLALRRVMVSGTCNREMFASLLRPGGIVKKRLMKTMRRIPQRVLGPRLWTPVSRMLRALVPGRASAVLVFVMLVPAATSAAMLLWLRRTS